jgi:hypothetical protein
MALLNQACCFEKRDADYVYRPTLFSPGFSISEHEKDLLFTDLRRLERSLLIKGGLFIALTASVFMTGVIETGAPIAWFMFCSIIGVTLLAAIAIYRRDRLVRRVLGDRDPDVARAPSRQALVESKLSINKRFAIKVLQSTIILFAVVLAACDALVFYVVLLAGGSLEPDGLVTRGMEHVWLGVVVAALNVVLVTGMVFAARQVRRLRTTPEPR